MFPHIKRVACLSLALALASVVGYTGAVTPARKLGQGASSSWIKRLPLVYLDDASAATLTGDGNLVVGIRALGREFTPNYMEFVKLAPDGKVLWRQRLANPESTGTHYCELPTKLREAADGSLLVAGHRCHDTRPHAWFARLDAKANLLWQVTPYQGLPPDLGPVVTDTYGWDLVEWGDGHLLGLGFGTSREGNVWWLDTRRRDGSCSRAPPSGRRRSTSTTGVSTPADGQPRASASASRR
jgi:hypothetical protein